MKSLITSSLLTYKRIRIEQKNLSFFFITSTISLVGSFLLTVAFANLLEKSAYGIYQYILSIVSIVSSFSLSGIGAAFVRAIGKKEYGFINFGQTKSIQWSLLPILISCVVSVYYFINHNYLIGFAVIICTFITIITQYFSRFIFILNGLELFFQSNFIQTTQAIAPILILLPLLFFTQDPLLLSIAYFGSIAIATLISNFYLGTSKVFERFNHSVLNPMYNKLSINFAAHRSLINILNVVTANFDKVLLFQTLGAHQTASYIIAISLPNRIKALIKQFEPYVFAKFANHSAEAVRSKLQSKFFFGLLISIPFFVLYVASAPFVFKVLLPQYENIALLSTIYAVSIFSGISFIPYAVLQAHAGEKEFYVYTVISSVIQIVFLLIGAHVALLSGAIIGKMLSSLVNTVIVFLMALRIGTSTNSSHTIISSPEIPS